MKTLESDLYAWADYMSDIPAVLLLGWETGQSRRQNTRTDGILRQKKEFKTNTPNYLIKICFGLHTTQQGQKVCSKQCIAMSLIKRDVFRHYKTAHELNAPTSGPLKLASKSAAHTMQRVATPLHAVHQNMNGVLLMTIPPFAWERYVTVPSELLRKCMHAFSINWEGES